MLKKERIAWLNEKDALWQYFLDHADPHEDGVYIAHIYVKSRDGFNGSIKARQQGLYKYTQEQVDKRKPVGRQSRLRQFLQRLLKHIP